MSPNMVNVKYDNPRKRRLIERSMTTKSIIEVHGS